ncbi:MAG: GNAT family N-acetyltransferase [Gammaproteobacteria bacterium]|nr:GNAT family N-acetyltransferase [Gammaproteobacteria bacterium]
MSSDQENSAVEFQFIPPRSLQAGWLSCRLIEADDADRLYEAVMTSIDHLRPWMPWVNDYRREMADEFVGNALEALLGRSVNEANYVSTDSEDNLLGIFGLHARLGPGALEIGYWVDVRRTRRGVATLSAALLAEAALSINDVDNVEIHHDEANLASEAIPARLGFERYASIHLEPDASGEVGIQVNWRMNRSNWPSSEAARLLAMLRRG